jgi:hypothetical protein
MNKKPLTLWHILTFSTSLTMIFILSYQTSSYFPPFLHHSLQFSSHPPLRSTVVTTSSNIIPSSSITKSFIETEITRPTEKTQQMKCCHFLFISLFSRPVDLPKNRLFAYSIYLLLHSPRQVGRHNFLSHKMS